MVRSVGHVAIGMNEISSGEFRVFRGKCHLCLWVSPWKFVSNVKMWQDEIRTICIIDWVVSFR